jgi:hypothetical protein
MDETSDTDDAISNQPSGLRGSNPCKEVPKNASDTDKFNMEEYDKETER